MWYIILGLITLIYVILNLVLPELDAGFLGVYVIRPILWITLSITVYLTSRKEGLNIWHFNKIRKWEIGRTPFEAAILIAGFQIALLIIAGIFLGFGESPYSFTPLSILINILFVISLLFGIELSRAYLIKKGIASRRNITLVIGLVTILFMLIHIAPSQFTSLNLSEPAESVKFIGETVIPLLAMSLFASYLAYIGGAMAAIGYMGTLQAFEWFSPVLPDLPWAMNALILTLTPTIGFLIIQNSIQETQTVKGGRRIRLRKKDPTLNWTGVSIVSIILIFFSFGFLGVQPTIIYSGSMNPAMDVGDVVIISEVPIDSIQTGDVIQFREGNITVIHRVYEIIEEENTRFFITKGDANNEVDADPVIQEQILGKEIFTIPKIGWIPIKIKEAIATFGKIV